MKLYALAAVTFLAGIGLVFAWLTGSAPVPGPRASGRTASPPLSVALGPSAPTDLPLSRNPFEYAEPRTVRLPPIAVFKGPPPSPSPANAGTAPVRLVGFMRRGGAVGVVLSIGGEVLVLSVGEEGGGYTLIAADEESGARLTGPDGSEVDLAFPSPSGS